MDVISLDAGAYKTRAAAEARHDPDFIIMSRTDTLATHGIEEVVRRLNAYAAAGADLLFADAVMAVDEIKAVVRGIKKPLCVNMGFGIRNRATTPLLSAKQLQDLGVSVVIYPRLLTASAIQGMKNALAVLDESLKTGEAIDRPDLLVSFEELNELVGMSELDALERRYLTEQQMAAKYRKTPQAAQ
jgi:2-methylisocitrate lyase-like PEP mutase family enzyme